MVQFRPEKNLVPMPDVAGRNKVTFNWLIAEQISFNYLVYMKYFDEWLKKTFEMHNEVIIDVEIHNFSSCTWPFLGF